MICAVPPHRPPALVDENPSFGIAEFPIMLRDILQDTGISTQIFEHGVQVHTMNGGLMRQQRQRLISSRVGSAPHPVCQHVATGNRPMRVIVHVERRHAANHQSIAVRGAFAQVM
jgi:hypothetical protein